MQIDHPAYMQPDHGLSQGEQKFFLLEYTSFLNVVDVQKSKQEFTKVTENPHSEFHHKGETFLTLCLLPAQQTLSEKGLL